MAHLITYLTFNGNCREAMNFYRDCLGGELRLETVGESPAPAQLPQPMRECILQATLAKDNLVLMATDMVGEEGLSRGNAVSILIDCNSKKELQQYFKKLSHEGQPTHPIGKTFWGAWFGGLTDKFGNHWLLTYRD